VVDTLADVVEPWVARAEQWAANHKAAREAGEAHIPAQDHVEPIVAAEAVRLDVPTTTAAEPEEAAKPAGLDSLAELDAELDAEVAGWSDTPAADDRGEGR
jgi:hypothetical protein